MTLQEHFIDMSENDRKDNYFIQKYFMCKLKNTLRKTDIDFFFSFFLQKVLKVTFTFNFILKNSFIISTLMDFFNVNSNISFI